MKRNKKIKGEKGIYSIGKTNRIGKTDNIGNTDSIGKTDRIGKTNSIGRVDKEFKFQRVHGRREFFDSIRDYIKENKKIERDKIVSYFQYTTGASPQSIYNGLKVLEDLGIIKSFDDGGVAGYYKIYYEIKELRNEN